MRVLVCGGRTYGVAPPDADAAAKATAERQARRFMDVMDGLHRIHRFHGLIHGGAPGADALAATWAAQWGVHADAYPVDWTAQPPGPKRNALGPQRNQRMLDEGKPDLVVSFAGGTGTLDMTNRALKAKVRVVEVADLDHDAINAIALI